MKESIWKSLLTHVVLLAIVACGFIAIAAGSFYDFLRGSHTSTVQVEQQHLASLGADVAKAYSAQVSSSSNGSLTSARTQQHTPPPPDRGRRRQGLSSPSLPPDPHDGPPPPPGGPAALILSSVLADERGIEGGFLAADGELPGYNFPHPGGPDLPRDPPGRERSTIHQLAQEAATSNAAKSTVYEGPHDAVLFYAQPVHQVVNGEQRVTGAIWLMKRLPDLNRGRNRQLLLAAVGFGSAALISAALAWLITVEVRGGVNAVTAHLGSLERDLSYQDTTAKRPRLVEFARVMDGIDAMAQSLQRRIASERKLEVELRHKERLSSLGQFAAGVAHELRNPLATIRLRTQMAQAQSSDEAILRSGQVILEEVDRLDAMIGKLLHFSRPISLIPRLVSLDTLCAAILESWRARVPLGVSLLLNCPADSVALTDPSRLTQVLDNLLENATQALGSSGGEITLTVLHRIDHLAIEIADSGAGFSPDALKHAFDPFFTTRDSGTGLGLSIAFELVQAFHGEIKAENRPEGGSIVTVTLPSSTAQTEVRE